MKRSLSLCLYVCVCVYKRTELLEIGQGPDGNHEQIHPMFVLIEEEIGSVLLLISSLDDHGIEPNEQRYRSMRFIERTDLLEWLELPDLVLLFQLLSILLLDTDWDPHVDHSARKP